MRRWVPGAARRPAPPIALRIENISGQDLAFCTEFAARGGVAASDQGFKAETDLARMQQAGLLILQRDQAPPFAVLRVALSPAMRELLSRNGPVSGRPPAGRPAVAGTAPISQGDCRRGFEVARGMISAAIKAEFAKPAAFPGAGGAADLERRLMARISTLQAPFESSL